jgi:hypothetical protein
MIRRMRARRRLAPAIVSVALLLITAAIALPAGADANGSGATLKCPTSGLHPSVKTITARGTSCANARKLETEWRRAAHPSNSPCDWVDGSVRPGICTIAGWRCVATHTVNGQTYATVCDRHRGRRQVRFILPV